MSKRKKKNSSLKWTIAIVLIIAPIDGTNITSFFEKADRTIIREATI